VIVTGEMNYRNWRKDGETSDRQQAEIVVGSDGKINFIDRETAY
jgi:single-stranded DNA-binding protein